MHIDAGVFLEAEIIFLQHQDIFGGRGHLVANIETDAAHQVGDQDGFQVGARNPEFALVRDAHQIADLAFGQNGMLGAGIENKFQRQKPAENDIQEDKIIDKLEGDIHLLTSTGHLKTALGAGWGG